MSSASQNVQQAYFANPTVVGGGTQDPNQEDYQDEASIRRAEIARHTFSIIQSPVAQYRASDGRVYDLSLIRNYLLNNTAFYDKEDPRIASWARPTQPRSLFPKPAMIYIVERSTMAATRAYATQYNEPDRIRVACLNFASARRPGGRFREGAAAQEESLARSSTLVLSLESAKAQPYYDERYRKGFHSHAMIYSPGVAFIKDDEGQLHQPYMANVVTSAAINAGEARFKLGESRELEQEIEREMEERMARVLQVCELRKDRVLVLGSFGTGIFQNSVAMVARIWAHLLGPGTHFSRAFQVVEFAILGRKTFEEFKTEFGRVVAARAPPVSG